MNLGDGELFCGHEDTSEQGRALEDHPDKHRAVTPNHREPARRRAVGAESLSLR